MDVRRWSQTVPAWNLYRNFIDAVMERLLETVKPVPNCIVSDKHLRWTVEIARKFGIPRYWFDGTSYFTLLCNHNIEASKILESVSGSEPFLVPGLPDEIEVTLTQLPAQLNPSNMDFRDFHKEIEESLRGSSRVIVNSFEELETQNVKGIKNISNFWCIGPMSLTNTTIFYKAQRGHKSSIDHNQCLRWLDLWPANSVVYVCLGSLGRMSTPQLVELGLGLEASNQPYVWVINGDKSKGWRKWLLENRFEDRIKRRGLLIHGWAQQVLILSHPAAGGFLIHWLEFDTGSNMCRYTNGKFIVLVLRIGATVGASGVIPLEESVASIKSGRP